jgi:hypothetical protein
MAEDAASFAVSLPGSTRQSIDIVAKSDAYAVKPRMTPMDG